MRIPACDKCLTITDKLHDVTVIIDGKEMELELCAGCKKELRAWMTPAHKLLGRKAFAADTPIKKTRKPRKSKKVDEKPKKVDEKPKRVDEKPKRVDEKPKKVDEKPKKVVKKSGGPQVVIKGEYRIPPNSTEEQQIRPPLPPKPASARGRR